MTSGARAGDLGGTWAAGRAGGRSCRRKSSLLNRRAAGRNPGGSSAAGRGWGWEAGLVAGRGRTAGATVVFCTSAVAGLSAGLNPGFSAVRVASAGRTAFSAGLAAAAWSPPAGAGDGAVRPLRARRTESASSITLIWFLTSTPMRAKASSTRLLSQSRSLASS